MTSSLPAVMCESPGFFEGGLRGRFLFVDGVVSTYIPPHALLHCFALHLLFSPQPGLFSSVNFADYEQNSLTFCS